MFRHAASAPTHTTDKSLGRRLEAIETRLDKLASYLLKDAPPPPPSRARATFTSATELVRAHPLAAAGFVFAVGYAALRIARR